MTTDHRRRRPWADPVKALRVAARMLGLLALSVVATATAARADFLLQERSFTDKTFNYFDTATLAFDSFDSLNGTRTLLGVEIRYEYTVKTRITIPIPASGTTTVSVGSKDEPVMIETSSPFDLPLDASVPPITSFVASFDPIEVSLSSTSTRPFSQTWVQKASHSATYVDTAILGRFSDPGGFTLSSEGFGWISIRGATGSNRPRVGLWADVKVSVIYEFGEDPGVQSVVPEPGSLALASIGGLGLIAAGFRSRRRASSPVR